MTATTTIERPAPPGRPSPPERRAPRRRGHPRSPYDGRVDGARPTVASPAAEHPAIDPPFVPVLPPPPPTDHAAEPGAIRLATDADLAGPGQDPGLLCANLAHCVVEILAGARSLDQLGRWVTDSVYIHLLRRTVLAARARAVSAQEAMRPRFRVGTPLLSHPSAGVVEAVVLVHQPSRSRAIAIRLERHRDRWRATAISVL